MCNQIDMLKGYLNDKVGIELPDCHWWILFRIILDDSRPDAEIRRFEREYDRVGPEKGS